MIDRTHDRLRESALNRKDRADSPDWRIAEGDSDQAGPAQGEALRNMSMKRAIMFAAAALLLAGCGESGRIFGFERGGPDEFTVVRNPPLSVPPQATLRPPAGATANPTAISAAIRRGPACWRPAATRPDRREPWSPTAAPHPITAARWRAAEPAVRHPVTSRSRRPGQPRRPARRPRPRPAVIHSPPRRRRPNTARRAFPSVTARRAGPARARPRWPSG